MNPIKTIGKRVIFAAKRSLAQAGYHGRPDLIIIGAQKAGTTALYGMLGQHPQVVAPRFKELNYFTDQGNYGGVVRFRYGDVAGYHAHLPLPYRLSGGQLTFDASPEYLYHPQVAARIYEYDPHIRLIAILREPVARAYSAWGMYRKLAGHPLYDHLAEQRSFEDAIEAELAVIEQSTWESDRIAYVKRGVYADQLARYWDHFPADRMLILEHSDFRQDQVGCLAQICRFVGVDPRYRFDSEQRNVTQYDEPIPPHVAERLHAFYAPHNERLFEMLGKEYDW